MLVSVSEQGQLIAFFRDAPRISSCMKKIQRETGMAISLPIDIVN